MKDYILPAIVSLVLIFLAVLVAKKKDISPTVKDLTVAGFIAVAVAIAAISGVMIWIDYSGWTVIDSI